MKRALMSLGVLIGVASLSGCGIGRRTTNRVAFTLPLESSWKRLLAVSFMTMG